MNKARKSEEKAKGTLGEETRTGTVPTTIYIHTQDGNVYTSDQWDTDLGGAITGRLQAHRRTMRKMTGLCPVCEGGIIGRGPTREALERGTWTCQCGARGDGQELLEAEWFTTTVQ